MMFDPDGCGPPSARTTIAVLLGAGEYPQKPSWSNPVLGESARALREYVLSPTGLALPPEHVLDLFDSPAGQVEQLFQIKSFLDGAGDGARDLLLYYIGHGGFDNDDYYLGIHGTQSDHEFITTIESDKLARTIRRGFRDRRIYVILDACFSASAVADWQSDELQAAIRKLARPLPRHGTAFLAAASKYDLARAPRTERFTVFTGAVLEVLTRGLERCAAEISMYELYEAVRAIMERPGSGAAGRPELYVPNQRDGDVSRVGIFPNAAGAGQLDGSAGFVDSGRVTTPLVSSLAGADTGWFEPEDTTEVVVGCHVLGAWDLDATTSRRSVREQGMEEYPAPSWGVPHGAPGDAASRAPAPLSELSRRVMNPMIVAATFVACAMTLIVVQMVWIRNMSSVPSMGDGNGSDVVQAIRPDLTAAGAVRSTGSALQTETNAFTRIVPRRDRDPLPGVTRPPAIPDAPCTDSQLPEREPWTPKEIAKATALRKEVADLERDCKYADPFFMDPGRRAEKLYCAARNAYLEGRSDALALARKAVAEGGRFKPYAMLIVGYSLFRLRIFLEAKSVYLAVYRSSPGAIAASAKLEVQNCNRRLRLWEDDGIPCL
jgi:hypothetical protein